MTIQPHNNRIPLWTLQDGLRKAREWADLDQTELADRLEVSRGTVSGYERGTTKPRRSMVIAWAFACDVEPEWLSSLPHQDSNLEPSGLRLSLVRTGDAATISRTVRHILGVSENPLRGWAAAPDPGSVSRPISHIGFSRFVRHG